MRPVARLFSRPAATSLSLAVVALSIGGVLLLRSPRDAGGMLASGVAGTSPFMDGPVVNVAGVPGVTAKLSLSQRKLQAGAKRQVFAEIELAAAAKEDARSSVAVAVAIDVSGSMAGAKIESAKRSLITLLDRMSDDDQIAVVTFESQASVLQPLARLGDVRAKLREGVDLLHAGGGTNIASALQLAYGSLPEGVNGKSKRVVLLSDGQDASGVPLERTGSMVRTNANAGVTLSSIGLGNDFDERYMTTLADVGRGNYAFLRTGNELEGFLTKELHEARHTVIEGAVAEVTLPSGWRTVRAYGVESQGASGKVSVPIGVLFAGDQRKVVIELEADPEASGSTHSVEGRVTFRAMSDDHPSALSLGSIAVATVAAENDVSASVDGEVQAHAVSVVAAAKQREAVDAWRQGRLAEAQQISDQNIQLLNDQQKGVNDKSALQAQAIEYARDREVFAKVHAGSESGRDYGLQANQGNWTRSKR